VSEKYTLIDAEKADPRSPFPVVLMCAALAVSTSAFYAWLTAAPSARVLRRAKLAVHVQAAFDAGRGAYGVRRVHAVLARSDDPQVAGVSPRMVRELMAEQDLRACQPRAYRTTTVPDPQAEPVIADQLGRDFTAPAPGAKLVGDITYVPTWQGWLYLATVIDCHSKAVVGWSMAAHMRAELVCDAITMAATNVEFAEGVVFHSDRGSQYTSTQFAEHLTEHGITGSMGRTGVCWDNAMAESFFAALKNELVHRTVFTTREKARRAIAEYIEVFYNRQRLHSGLGYKTPHEVTNEYRQNTEPAA
jgi:putative transposase